MNDRFGRLLYWAAIINAELLVSLIYAATIGGVPSTLRGVAIRIVPWVWCNVALWTYHTTSIPTGDNHRVAAAVATGYFFVLAVVGGLLLPGAGDLATGLRITTATPPGFSPAVLYSGSLLIVNLIPYKLLGYLTLAWLVYGTVLDVSGSVAAGVLGLFSCVSCVLPVLAAVVSAVTGGVGFAATIGNGSYVLSTVVFVVTVLLLRWRPDFETVARLRARLA